MSDKLHLEQLEAAVLPVFKSMSHKGLYIDRDRWQKTLQAIKLELQEAKQHALRLLSRPEHLDLFGESTLNLDSPQEVQKALDRVQEPKTALAALKHYRETAKLVQSYGDTFLESIVPQTWRIHSTFEPQGTSTGRVSSHSPNIQNLPSDPCFQACLIAPPGKKLVLGDYAACELRILADFSGEPIFIKAFEEDLDLHAQVALELFGDIQYRPQAKAINFGIIYGMGAQSLASSLSISVLEAEKLLHRYFQKHTRIQAFLKYCVESAYKNGFAQTRLGRKLILDTRQDISRIAKNMPIQGTAAEIAKLAMVQVHKHLQEFQEAFLVNMIHDELVVECLEADASKIAEVVKYEMELAEKTLIPRVKPKAEVEIRS